MEDSSIQATPNNFSDQPDSGAGVGAVLSPAARAGAGASPCRARPRHTTATCKGKGCMQWGLMLSGASVKDMKLIYGTAVA